MKIKGKSTSVRILSIFWLRILSSRMASVETSSVGFFTTVTIASTDSFQIRILFLVNSYCISIQLTITPLDTEPKNSFLYNEGAPRL